MLRYQLICCDLDDTLITSEAKLTDGVKQAVIDYTAAGGRFCIVTGRMTPGVVSVYKELGLSTETASFQGAIISDINSGEIISETVIDCERAARIAGYIESRGFYCQTYYGDRFLTARANEYTVLYGKLSCAEYVETGIPISRAILSQKINPPKLLIMAEPEKVPAFKEELIGLFGEEFLINTSKPFIIEIIPKGISKAEAVRAIASRHGIEKQRIICIGDSENDLPMLCCGGLGVAVNNASDYVKSFVEVVAPDNNHDGVAWTIRNYGLLTE